MRNRDAALAAGYGAFVALVLFVALLIVLDRIGADVGVPVRGDVTIHAPEDVRQPPPAPRPLEDRPGPGPDAPPRGTSPSAPREDGG